MPESTGCSPAVQPDSSAGNVTEIGTSALRWPSYALAILRCWQAIFTGSGAGTPPPVHTATALTRRQSTWSSIVQHEQARRDIWPGGQFNTDPRRLWDFPERIGAVTRPLTGNERERETDGRMDRQTDGRTGKSIKRPTVQPPNNSLPAAYKATA